MPRQRKSRFDLDASPSALCRSWGRGLAITYILDCKTPIVCVYGAVVYTLIALQGFFVLVLAMMGLYTVAQGVIGLALVHGFPRLTG